MKTTITLDDELYRKLVKEALEKYGSTRKLSFLINEKLKKMESVKAKPMKRMTFKLKKILTPKQIEELIEKGLGEMAE